MKYRDYYQTLGVERDASQDQVRAAFRKLARKYHPDVAADKSGAEEKFKEINEAYEVLGDPEKRKKYDSLGPDWQHMGQGAPAGGGGYGGFDFGSAGPQEWHFEGTGFSDFFENMFGSRAAAGGGFSRRGGYSGATMRRAGRDIESEILVTLEEVMHGSERSLAVTAPEAPGRNSVRIRIPRCVSEGQLIRATGLGEPGSHGGPPGDLFLRVRLERHPDFHPDGPHLIYDLSLAPWEAVLGATVPVRTPHGTSRIKIPPGTTAGTELRLAGKGLPIGTTGSFGDLFARTTIATPTALSDEERRHWQALAAASNFNPR